MRPIKDIFSRLFGRTKEGSDGWTQSQREALVDLLLLAMYIDNHLSLAEERVLAEQAASLQWEGPRSLDAYVDAATSRVRELRGADEGKAGLLEFVRERLDTLEDRQRAFFVCQSLLSSDGRDAEEKAFADFCKSALGL